MVDELGKTSRFAAFERRLIDRLAERNLAHVRETGEGIKGRASVWQWVLAVVVLPVHLVSLVLAGWGIFLLVTGDNWLIKAIGLVVLILAAALRPRAPRRPRDVLPLRPEDAPVLFEVLGEVSACTGSPVPHEVWISNEFNAFVNHVGWSRRRVLCLGAPLWVSAVPRQALVAVIAHELGHFGHRDLTHGRWVGGAQQALSIWGTMLLGGAGPGTGGLILNMLVVTPLVGLIEVYLRLIEYLNGPSHQRQEFLADLDSVRTAGTDGTIAMLDSILAVTVFDTASTRVALSMPPGDLWDEVRTIRAADNAVTIQNRRTNPPERAARIDDTHPSTVTRIELVQALPYHSAAVVIDRGRWGQVDAELKDLLDEAAEVILERVRYRW